MDAPTWRCYVLNLLRYPIDAPSLLLVDNFDSHVSEGGVNLVVEEALSEVCPLSKNSTSVRQPLDVRVMGPLKMEMRELCRRERRMATTAQEKRLVVILCTIQAWEELSHEIIVGGFEKALPKFPYAAF